MSQFRNAVQQIRESEGSRIVNLPNSGKVKIEVLRGGEWVTVLRELERPIAEDVIRQASNRVILG
jgi:hypothetical protein